MKSTISILMAILIVGLALAILQRAVIAITVVFGIAVVLFILRMIYEANPKVKIRRAEEARLAAESAQRAAQAALEHAEHEKRAAAVVVGKQWCWYEPWLNRVREECQQHPERYEGRRPVAG